MFNYIKLNSRVDKVRPIKWKLVSIKTLQLRTFLTFAGRGRTWCWFCQHLGSNLWIDINIARKCITTYQVYMWVCTKYSKSMSDSGFENLGKVVNCLKLSSSWKKPKPASSNILQFVPVMHMIHKRQSDKTNVVWQFKYFTAFTIDWIYQFLEHLTSPSNRCDFCIKPKVLWCTASLFDPLDIKNSKMTFIFHICPDILARGGNYVCSFHHFLQIFFINSIFLFRWFSTVSYIFITCILPPQSEKRLIVLLIFKLHTNIII